MSSAEVQVLPRASRSREKRHGADACVLDLLIDFPQHQVQGAFRMQLSVCLIFLHTTAYGSGTGCGGIFVMESRQLFWGDDLIYHKGLDTTQQKCKSVSLPSDSSTYPTYRELCGICGSLPSRSSHF